MDIHEYPRPENDTGIGIHWVAGYASAIGMGKIRELWIPELKALGVKWVKIFNHDGALDFVDLLLEEGFMPIVQLYQTAPNPGHLGVKEIVHLEAYARAGVKYFEFNSEPDLESSWKGSRMPSDAIDTVVENIIIDMETILERGGMPAIPALSSGSRWDLVGRILLRGRRDLLEGPVWQALHNYPQNRPLDYPFDIGNQEGAAYTERFYRAVGEESWGESAWRGRSLRDVNRLRMSRSSPGATLEEDHACWLSYRYFDALNRQHLGRSLPILSTECGFRVGEDSDPRYPATTPNLHMAQTLEACRIMMGSSRRFESAPDYYFCTAFWLIANNRLGGSSSWWENHAWYSSRWAHEHLPIVPTLRDEPKSVRAMATAAPTLITVRGHIQNAPSNQLVELEDAQGERTQTSLDSRGNYELRNLSPGHYRLSLPGANLEQPLELTADRESVVLNLSLERSDASNAASTVYGAVRGGAGAVVILLRVSDGDERVAMARQDGAFRFINLPAGVYSARVQPNGTRVDNIQVDGRNEQRVELSTVGWGHTVKRLEDPAAVAGVVRCAAEAHPQAKVILEGSQWQSEIFTTSSEPIDGLFRCDITDVEPGDYLLRIIDDAVDGGGTTALEARVHVDRKTLPLVEFVYTEPGEALPPAISSIRGVVTGATQPVDVVLVDGQANSRTCKSARDGTFAFEGLAAGQYEVGVAGFGNTARRTDIALDGTNHVEVELILTPPVDISASGGIIAAFVPDGEGKLATLVDTIGNEYNRVVDEERRVHFEHLPPGRYELRVEGGYLQADLEIEGEQGLEVHFSPLLKSWVAEVSRAGSMPGFSVVRVEVAGRADWPVHIWQEDGQTVTRRTGLEGTEGACVAEFTLLEPGSYMVEPEHLETRAEIELTGLEALWVNFRPQVKPFNPNVVQRVNGAGSKAVDARFGAGDVMASHYLFVADGMAFSDQLLALLQFVANYRPTIGNDIDVAKESDQVTVVGDVPESVLAALGSNGAKVSRLGVHSGGDQIEGGE